MTPPSDRNRVQCYATITVPRVRSIGLARDFHPDRCLERWRTFGIDRDSQIDLAIDLRSGEGGRTSG